jgi:hypothetical protein
MAQKISFSSITTLRRAEDTERGEVIAGTTVQPHAVSAFQMGPPLTPFRALRRHALNAFTNQARAPNPGGRLRCQHPDQIKWGNGNCNFSIQTASFLLVSSPLTVVSVVAQCPSRLGGAGRSGEDEVLQWQTSGPRRREQSSAGPRRRDGRNGNGGSDGSAPDVSIIGEWLVGGRAQNKDLVPPAGLPHKRHALRGRR